MDQKQENKNISITDTLNRIMESFNEKFTERTVLTESSLSRIYLTTKDRSIGMITAFRGRDENNKPISKATNKMRNQKLYADLMAEDRDLRITRVFGQYSEEAGDGKTIDVKEETFFVASSIEGDDQGHLERILYKLGRKYGQDAVLIKNFGEDGFLLGTNSSSFPGFGKKYRVGRMMGGSLGQFMTKIRGRPFVFESAQHVYYPSTINGIRALKILQETDLSELLD